jgi:hypothetical protein
MNTIDWQSDNLVAMAGPVIAETGLPPSEDPSGGVSAKLYDTNLDCRIAAFETTLAQDYVTGSNTFYVIDSLPIIVGNVLLMDTDDHKKTQFTVTLVDPVTHEITVSASSQSSASADNTVSCILYALDQNQIPLDNFNEWEDGMAIEISLDDGTVFDGTVEKINPDAGYLKLKNDVIPSAVSAGAVVKRKIGADVSMAAFGTFPTSDPVPGDPTWGFRGTIDHDHAELALGMRLRAEITYVDGGTNIRRKAIGTVINT